MADHLTRLSSDARARVERGYYDHPTSDPHTHKSLKTAVRDSPTNAIITEVKFSSPSQGIIRKTEPVKSVADSMVRGGACAISVLTDPDNFNGELGALSQIASTANVPVLMKDIIVSPRQLEAGVKSGADAVVIISELYLRKLGMVELPTIIESAHALGLEVLAEANHLENFIQLKSLHPDLYGINNRNLSSLQVDLSRTENIIAKAGTVDGPIVSESGVSSPTDVRRLRRAGANAILVGTSVMKSPNVADKVRELVQA